MRYFQEGRYQPTLSSHPVPRHGKWMDYSNSDEMFKNCRASTPVVSDIDLMIPGLPGI